MIKDSPSHRERITRAYQDGRAAEAQINNLDFTVLDDAGATIVAALETAVAKHRQIVDRKLQEKRFTTDSGGKH